MKIFRRAPILLLIFILSQGPSHAQLLNRIKNTAQNAASRAVERKVEREVEKAVEKQIERSWTKAFGEQTDAEGNPIAFSKIMQDWDLDVQVEDHYQFQGQAIMDISGTDQNGSPIEPMIFHSYLNKEHPFTAMRIDNDQTDKMTMIFDGKNNATVILMEKNGDKSSIAYAIDWGATEVTDQPIPSASHSATEFKKTGKTKTILGHLCEEYEVDDEEGKGSFWITKDEIDGITNFWGNSNTFFNQKLKTNNPKVEGMPEGSMLEMNYASNKDKSSSLFVMKEMDMKAINRFDMKDFPNVMKGSAL